MLISELKNIIRKFLPKKLLKFLLIIKNLNDFDYCYNSYSQEGEDMLLRTIFGNKKGFYIDIGAHHPKRFSNTYYFYKNGWNGINIDAMPGSMYIFNKIRPRDVNLEIAISKNIEELDYYAFDEPAFNGFLKNESVEKIKKDGYNVLFSRKIKTKTLTEVLNLYLKNESKIDFMSIDVEGLDLEVLQSNDWNKYKPDFLLVEIQKYGLENLKNHKIYEFISNKEYELICSTINTFIFKRKS